MEPKLHHVHVFSCNYILPLYMHAISIDSVPYYKITYQTSYMKTHSHSKRKNYLPMQKQDTEVSVSVP